jgi:hypothetical protein
MENQMNDSTPKKQDEATSAGMWSSTPTINEAMEIKMSTVQVITKLATMTDIFKAATLLHKLGLVDEAPHTFVKRYVEANPDINEALSMTRSNG